MNKHEFIEDCYIAQHPEKSRLAAWIGLTEQGIQFFRERAKSAYSQAKTFLRAFTRKGSYPSFWRFTYQLPRNSQSKINKLEFNRTCLETCKDAIWLEQSKMKIHKYQLGLCRLI